MMQKINDADINKQELFFCTAIISYQKGSIIHLLSCEKVNHNFFDFLQIRNQILLSLLSFNK